MHNSPSFCRVRPPGMISFDRSYHFDVLKDALVRAIEDIDAEFSEACSYIFLLP